MEPGLRERKKAATRKALSEAAMELAMRHGVGNITAESIADAADVSPRTFHNYFSSKEEAIVAVVADNAGEMIEAFRARPPEEPVWDALENALVGLFETPDQTDDEQIARLVFIRENAPLMARELAALQEMMHELAGLVALRSGTDADADLYPNLQAQTACMCAMVAVDRWLADPRGASPAELTRQAFAQVRAGLPEPGSHRPANDDVHR
ncbi:TetR/AcrR family transcriptional regulator [Phytoactinopolyspora mesophila]|nr:TetR/AcrR family transcriptional regulator [Phytoactinopolyspora mesophila]